MKQSIFLAVFLAGSLFLHSGGNPPPTLTVTAPIQHVYCGGPCCCGDVTVRYQGRYYGDPSYCRWFRPLKNGQLVTTRVWRQE